MGMNMFSRRHGSLWDIECKDAINSEIIWNLRNHSI